MHTLILIVAILLTVLTLPGTLQLIFLTTAALLPKRKIPVSEKAPEIQLAVVIPAHNEEAGIGNTLQSLQACDHPLDNQNIFVVADNCTDNTADIARKSGVSVIERQNDQLRGKGYALHYAFEKILQQDFDGIIVIDADTVVDKNLLDSYRQLFANGESAGQTADRVKNADAGIRPRLMHIAFLAFNYLRPLARDNVNLSVGILGNGFGLSAETLREIPYDSFSIVEDLEYHLRLIQAGKKVRFLHHTAVWSDMPVTGADAQSQRERWEGGRLRILKEQVPRLARQIITKGNTSLIEPLFELLLLPLAFHVLLLVTLLLIGPLPFRLYALSGLLVVVIHVLTAMLLGKATWQDWKALMAAPFYIIWKATRLGGILKTAGKGTAWKRTRR